MVFVTQNPPTRENASIEEYASPALERGDSNKSLDPEVMGSRPPLMYKEDFEKTYCSDCEIKCNHKGCYNFRYEIEGLANFKVPRKRNNPKITKEVFSSIIWHYPIIIIMFSFKSRNENWFKEITKPSDLLDKLYDFLVLFNYDFFLMEKYLREAWWVKYVSTSYSYSVYQRTFHTPMFVCSNT